VAARLLQVVVFPYRGCSFTAMPQTKRSVEDQDAVGQGCCVFLACVLCTSTPFDFANFSNIFGSPFHACHLAVKLYCATAVRNPAAESSTLTLNQWFNCGLWVSFSLAFYTSPKTSIFPSTLQCKGGRGFKSKGRRIHFGSANLGPIWVR